MPEGLRVLAPLIVAALGTGLVAGLGAIRPRLAAPLAIATAALAFVATLLLGTADTVDAAWAPTLGLRLSFASDGLAQLYALLATGIGLVVVTYATGYMPRHLHHHGDPPERVVRFYALVLLFMTAMIGMVMAQDLVLLILFWDLTAITSYFLIGYNHERRASRRAALTALLVTGISAIFLIAAGALLLHESGTSSIPDMLATSTPGRASTIASVLIIIAALAKSAQAPLHFWLPRAMAAPTPVSAYLHSAAMVAAGVFLLGRMHPLLALDPRLLDALVVVGFASMMVGGVMALAQSEFKRLLAYSTIGQYGYVVVLLGLADTAGAALYVLVHAVFKCALFLTAGTVMEATGQDRLEQVGGLRRDLPWLAVGSGLATAGLVALPLTGGFFKDEVFFAAAAARGGIVQVLAVAGAVLTFAYGWRFWGGIFAGKRGGEVRTLPWVLTAPVVLLGTIIAVLGIAPGWAADLAVAAGVPPGGTPTPLSLGYYLEPSAPNLMALATWGIGLVAIATARFWIALPLRAAQFGRRYGPERAGTWMFAWLGRLSRQARAYEVQTLQQRVGTIFVAAAILVGVTIVFAPPWPSFRVGRLPNGDWPLVLVLALAALSGIAATRSGGRLTLVLALSAVGYSISAVFVFIGAPDVALVAVLIETMMTLLLLGVLSLLARTEVTLPVAEQAEQRLRARIVGLLAAGFAFVVVWGVLSRPAPEATAAQTYLNLAPEANADDVVTAILADFRGLDTLGEVTVVSIALLGALTLFAKGMRRRT